MRQRDLSPRLDRLFEAGCDWLAAQGQPDHAAVRAPDGVLTYHELDCLANQLARYLLSHGVGPGDRVGILLDQGSDTYIAMLAVLKVQAVYVSMNLGSPADRVAHLIAGAGVHTVVSETSMAERLHVPRGGPDLRLVLIDAEALEISRCAPTRLSTAEHGGPVGELASIVYPAGPAASPGGVEISHSGVCNFALTTAKLSGLRVEDRVFEGLSGAPSFSVEGIWVAWIVGATMVPKGPGPSLWGPRLRRFLATNRVTALYCTPVLLAGLDEDLPELRFVLLSGQPCPGDLLLRWRRPGRRVISVYGTTEPDRPSGPAPVAASGLTNGPAGSIPPENCPPGNRGVRVFTSDVAASG